MFITLFYLQKSQRWNSVWEALSSTQATDGNNRECCMAQVHRKKTDRRSRCVDEYDIWLSQNCMLIYLGGPRN